MDWPCLWNTSRKGYECSNGSDKEHLGGIRDFLYEKQIESLHELESDKQGTKQAAVAADKPMSDSKADYLEKKELQKRLRMCKKKVTELEAAIEKVDGEIKAVEDKLNANDGDMQEAYMAHAELSKKREQLMDDWEAATEELDGMEEA